MKRALWIVPVIAVVLVGLVAFSQGWLPGRAAVSAETSTSALPRAITVVGEGKVKIKPDIATVNIGVETVSATVKEATTQASQTMEAVMAALRAAGVDAKDMQTSGYSIWADRNYGPEGNSTETVRYRVNNNLQITIRDLDKVGVVIDAAIEAGANAIHGIQFSLAEPSAVEAEARAKAIENARAKAAELAELSGVQVGQVISVSEVVGQGGGYLNSNFAYLESAKMGMGGGADTITPGELELSMRLQVVYAIQ